MGSAPLAQAADAPTKTEIRQQRAEIKAAKLACKRTARLPDERTWALVKRKAKCIKQVPVDPYRYEWIALPVVAANSSVGLVLGATSILAKFNPAYAPFRFRAQLVGMISIRQFQGERQVLLQRYGTEFEFAGLARGRLRLLPSASYTLIPNVGFYGIGNNDPHGVNASPGDDTFYRYRREIVEGNLLAQVRLVSHLDLIAGLTLRWTQLGLYEGSLLEAYVDAVVNDGDDVNLLPGVEAQFNTLGGGGLQWDTRNDESFPSDGMLSRLTFRHSIGGEQGTSFTNFVGLNLDARFYEALLGPRLMLSVRAMGDMMIGQPPVFELARAGFPPDDSIGGGQAIRGIPAGRYHGAVKILAAIELGTTAVDRVVFGHRLRLGFAGFFDTGRVWARVVPTPEFDAYGPWLKWGAGLGIRLGFGEAIRLRLDVAFSPHGDPNNRFGFYLDGKSAI